MTKLLAGLGIALSLLLSGVAVYVADTNTVETGGKGGTSNADAFSLDSFLSVGTYFLFGTGPLNGSAPSAGQDTGFTMLPKTGNCSTASSTIFAVQNPFGATSTLMLASIYGTEGATTTDILVGTSTTPAPAGLAVSTSTVGKNIFGMFSVTASSKFFSVAGVTMGPGTGYVSPSGGTYPTSQVRIVVGPNEWIVGFSTSTAPSNGAGGLGVSQLGVPASCVYKFIFGR